MIALAGFIYGGLNPAIQEELIQHIQSNFPPPLPSQEIIGLALNTLNQDAGLVDYRHHYGYLWRYGPLYCDGGKI